MAFIWLLVCRGMHFSVSPSSRHSYGDGKPERGE